MGYQIGTLLRINNLDAKVIGFIQYENLQDPGKEWTEYRLWTKQGEKWLSCDEHYQEYSISSPANTIRGQIGPEWHKVDEGTQIVRRYGGDVDVDPGERASFIEYEDETEEQTLSVEIWSDGTEYSTGCYVEQSDIQVVGFEKPTQISNNSNAAKATLACVVIFLLISFLSSIFSNINTARNDSVAISQYLESSPNFTYETSITGSENQKATVYTYNTGASGYAITDDVAKQIIDGIDGNTESVTQKDDEGNAEIAILTNSEYCLIYHPEDDADQVFVQISDRKYNYTSDNAPYRSSTADTRWYRSHYYSSGYSADSGSFSSTPSAYSMYTGDTIHNIGNGYFDSYSSSVRQSSINNRSSSGGGLSSGK